MYFFDVQKYLTFSLFFDVQSLDIEHFDVQSFDV
jgi:hypothetical protein